jgi:hypothetical protein
MIAPRSSWAAWSFDDMLMQYGEGHSIGRKSDSDDRIGGLNSQDSRGGQSCGYEKIPRVICTVQVISCTSQGKKKNEVVKNWRQSQKCRSSPVELQVRQWCQFVGPVRDGCIERTWRCNMPRDDRPQRRSRTRQGDMS